MPYTVPILVNDGDDVTDDAPQSFRSGILELQQLGQVGYAAATADQGGITSFSNISSMTVAPTCVVNRIYKITASFEPRTTVANDVAWCYITRNGGQIKVTKVALPYVGVGLTTYVTVRVTGLSGVHTFQGAIQRVVGTGTITNGAAADNPSFMLVECIGMT